MKEGYILKSLDKNQTDNSDMELINGYTIKNLTADDVMIFKVVLCDNEIDRDFESFTQESLIQLGKLFVGKSGIVDHSMKSNDQLARIFKAEVENLSPRKNSVGEDYLRIVAKAYIVKSSKNNDLISDIESGIKKEVSVNCSVRQKICSICGKNYGECRHIPGNYYDTDGVNRLCYIKLEGVKDAYEWSFVAVPAQINAGVIKNFKKKDSFSSSQGRNVEELLNKLKKGFCVNLNGEEALNISKKVEKLKYLSEKGEIYEENLRKTFMKTAFNMFPDLPAKTLSSVSEKMNIDELDCFTLAFKSLDDRRKNILPQTMPKNSYKKSDNIQFRV